MNHFSPTAILKGLNQLIFPLHCIQCNTALLHQAFPICPVCLTLIEKVDNSEPLALLKAENQVPIHFSYSHWYYDRSGVVQRVHHALKYGNRPQIGISLGRLIGHGIEPFMCTTSRPDTIVPVPLHKSRFLERGYNQSVLLTKGIAEILGVSPSINLLTRTQATRPQTGLSKQQRKGNVDGVFSVKTPDNVQGLHILLVDDVLTTGATLFSAARSLHDAGASRVSIAVLGLARS